MLRALVALAIGLAAATASATPRLSCEQRHASGAEATVGGDDRPITGRYVRCGLLGAPAHATRAVIELSAEERAPGGDTSLPAARDAGVDFWFTLYPGRDYTPCAPATRVRARAFTAEGVVVADVEQIWRQRCPAPRDRGAAWDDDVLAVAPRSARELVDRVASAMVDEDVETLVAAIPPWGLRLGSRVMGADDARRFLRAAGPATLTGIEPECDPDGGARCRFGKWTVLEASEGKVLAGPAPAEGAAAARCLIFLRTGGGWRWAGTDYWRRAAK